MTPFLALVAAGFAVFVVAISGAWIQDLRYERTLTKPTSR